MGKTKKYEIQFTKKQIFLTVIALISSFLLAFASGILIGNRFLDNKVKIHEVIALGGVAKKSDFVMQTLSNVLNLPIKVASSFETCALGSAMYAAVVGGVYATIQESQKAIGHGMEKEYHPEIEKVEVFEHNYKRYLALGAQLV